MTDMRPRRQVTVFGPRFMLAMLLATFATFAQEADDLEPAVDTSAELEPAVDTSADEAEEIEPAVSSAALATDVTRDERSGYVMDSIDLGRTEITGNAELPTVLYIVPWQKAEPGDMQGKPVNTLLDEVLAPLDREEFVRQVNYYDDLNGVSEDEE